MAPPDNMTGIWLEDKKLRVRPLEPPSPVRGEALIRLRLAGICGTDMELVNGYYPYRGVPGHEFVGEVVKAPSDPELLGQRVVGEINASCGQCDTCLALRPTHCEERTVLGIINRNGVFSEFFTLPAKNLHIVPPSIPDTAAVFTEPLAAACQILEQVPITPDHKVLLIGAGRLGQLIAQVLSLTGCKLLVAAKHPVQAALLKGRDIAIADLSLLPERSMDVVVEATGDPSGFTIAKRAVRPRGTIVLKSTYHGSLQVDFSPLVVDEVTLVGSRCGPFSKALHLMEQSLVDPTPAIEETYSLSQGLLAFEHAAKRATLKVLLQPCPPGNLTLR